MFVGFAGLAMSSGTTNHRRRQVYDVTDSLAAIHHSGSIVGTAARLDFDDSAEAAGLERIDQLTARLSAAIRGLTGCDRTSVILHAYAVPADRWHAMDAPLSIMPRNERPTHVAKEPGPMFTAWCAEGKECAALILAQFTWDRGERAMTADVDERYERFRADLP